jgi:hypothetical protein
MRASLVTPQRGARLDDDAILAALARGVTQFESLLAALPGIYPSVALNALRRLVSQGQVPRDMWVQAVQHVSQRRPHDTRACHHMAMPIPHPLDYDWRFSEVATQALLAQCLDLTRPSDTVALLGTPSVLKAAVTGRIPRQWILLDTNPLMTTWLTHAAPDARVLQWDVRQDPLPDLVAELVIVDPPWYEDYMRAFLWAACQLSALGGYLLVSVPPVGTRPGMVQEWARTLAWAQQLGLTLLREELAALPYVTPPFERNALQAEGLYMISEDWRRGNLAVFVRTQLAHVLRPQPVDDAVWAEEVLLGMRVRIRPQPAGGFQDPTLKPLVPGDVLPSVSRRDPRRRLADVWTSGNRIFACLGRHVLRQIVPAIAGGRAPAEAVAAGLQRPLHPEEQRLVTRAAHQLLRIARHEQHENMRFEEG